MSVHGSGTIVMRGQKYRFDVSDHPDGGYFWSAWREGESEPIIVTISAPSMRRLLDADSRALAAGGAE